MKQRSGHITAFLMAGFLFLPLSLDLIHVFFSGHHHSVCFEYADTHIHPEDSGCDVFQFNQTVLSYSLVEERNGLNLLTVSEPPSDSRPLFYVREILQQGLRAPPALRV